MQAVSLFSSVPPSVSSSSALVSSSPLFSLCRPVSYTHAHDDASFVAFQAVHGRLRSWTVCESIAYDCLPRSIMSVLPSFS
ncbi:hypothetical protein EXIGLDRAFT_40690 [Exidia glandulosa HHB12029]|uniref:Uncharacterized protein n=1 Tax=Exidia glandulosa HHB12029 TaxID=1314781 RepID=A0A165ILX4_EXIGL|nr:hypothetical protein EXIGLDRAFT_40690 [Exidia glandulosa HHB12029]